MKIFARIKDNRIVEYPVYEVHIKNRAHPESLYVECIFDNKPTVPEFHYLTENKRIENGKVYVSYNVLPVSLENLLKRLNPEPKPGQQPITVSIDDLQPEFVNRIIYLIKQGVQNKLEAFAKEKQFDSLESLISYKDSTNPEWAQQAAIAILKRDQTWLAYIKYFDDVTNKVLPVPKTENDIYSKLPDLTWD